MVAALAHGPDAHDYTPPVAEPEDYVLLLVSDPTTRGAGRRLLDEGWTRARAAGVPLQRVDCYAGDDGRLVRFYESAGFTRAQTFDVDGWPAQLLERRAGSSGGSPSPPGAGAGARPRSARDAR